MLLLLCSFDTSAAIPADPLDIEQSKQRAKAIEEDIQQKLQEAPAPVAPAVISEIPPLIPEGKCQLIKKIWLYGADHLNSSAKESIFDLYVDHCIENRDIANLRIALQSWYLDNGYITTQINIKSPQSSLDKGNLEIWVIEGRIANITIGDDSTFNRLRIKSAFPIRKGDVVNIHDLDQGMEQLNRLASQKFRMQIVPAEIAGYSDIILSESTESIFNLYPHAASRHIGRQLFDYQFTNGGIEETGENLHNISFTRENLIGVNDTLSLSYQRNIPLERGIKQNESIYFNFNVPWGYWFFKLNYLQNETARKVAATNATFFSKGKIESTNLAVNYLISRANNRKTELTSTIKYSGRYNYINDTRVETSSRRVSSLDLGIVHTQYMDTSTLVFSLSGSRGMHWFGTLQDMSDLAEDSPRAQYTLYKMFAYYQQRILPVSQYGFTFQSALNTQYSSDTLYGENQFVIGGEYSVRGFKENIISDDGGWTLRNDLNLPIGHWSQARWQNKWTEMVNAEIFYDIGKGRSVQGDTSELMSGWGYGISYNYRWINISFDRAKAIKSSNLFDNDEGWINYFNFNVKIII